MKHGTQTYWAKTTKRYHAVHSISLLPDWLGNIPDVDTKKDVYLQKPPTRKKISEINKQFLSWRFRLSFIFQKKLIFEILIWFDFNHKTHPIKFLEPLSSYDVRVFSLACLCVRLFLRLLVYLFLFDWFFLLFFLGSELDRESVWDSNGKQNARRSTLLANVSTHYSLLASR